MQLKNFHIRNFKCFDELDIKKLHPNMNVLIGNNATGKSSILEALRVLIGSLYLGYDKYDNKISVPGITDDDIRLLYVNKSLEPQIPVVVEAEAEFDNFEEPGNKKTIRWCRAVETKGGRTTTKDAKEIKQLSQDIQTSVREGSHKDIPLIAFFSTDRYKKERKDMDVKASGSRLQGYFNALDVITNIKFFLDLFFTETLDELQSETKSEQLSAVRNSVEKCLGKGSLYYSIKQNQFLFDFKSTGLIPFNLLSDGVRSVLALVMELAFRCYLLNPHLGAEAPSKTKGIVLIDEIDLHLHPSWQKHILNDLRDAFPNIQFIVTTHAPLVISQVSDCSIFSIADRKIYDFPNQNGRDANYILSQMDVKPFSGETKDLLDRYFGMIDAGRGKSDESKRIRTDLEAILGRNHAELQRADILLSFF